MTYLIKQWLGLFLGLLVVALLPIDLAAQSPGIQYAVVLNGTTYEVYLQPNFAPTTGTQVLTAQVTIKVPHDATNPFTIRNLANATSGVSWSLSSRINAPNEDRNADYLSFTASFFDNTALLGGRTARQPFKLFTFQNAAACTGVVTVMSNSDAFNHLPNSVGTNPGNSLEILGTTGVTELYTGNYTTIPADCTKADLALTIGKPLPNFQVSVTSAVPANVTNSGAAPSGPATASFPLPKGITTPTSFASNGWTCTRRSGTVSCTNPGPLNPSTSSAFSLPMTPDLSALGTTPTLNGTVSTTNDNNPANNNAPAMTPSLPVAGSPDLTITVGQPIPALKDGITSQMLTEVANIGSGPTTGPLTALFQLPTGLTTPADFTNNNWHCTTNGVTVTCLNTTPLAPGTSQWFSLPVTPISSIVGSTPLPALTCNVLTPNEANTKNNSCTSVSPGPVAGAPDLTVRLDQPSPLLKTGVTSHLPVAISNIGTAATTGPITVLLPLPANIDVPVSFTPGNDWRCTTNAGVVQCTNSNALGVGATTGFALPVTPANAAIGTTPTFNATVSTSDEPHTTNNQASPLMTPPVTSGTVTLPLKVYLGDVYEPTTGLMRDDLRALQLIPATSPYSSAAATVNPTIFAVTGNDAIVDWVLVELRDAAAPATVVVSKAALLQRDGDIVDLDGVSVPGLPASLTNQRYYVAVKHRNHLGVMTASPVTLANPTALSDFTALGTSLYGLNAERMVGDVRVLWSGNTDGNKTVVNAGPNNDVNPILVKILSDPANINRSTNYISSGYLPTDVNLDGQTIVAGPNNDVNPILLNIFTHPGNIHLAYNYVIQEQVP